MISINITADIGDVKKFLREMRERAQNLRPVLEGPILSDIRSTFAGIWSTAGNYGGVGSWPMLTEATMKRKRGGSAEILVESGDLRASLTEPGATGSVVEISDNEMEVGTDIDYARYHQTGTPNMAQRQIIPDEWPPDRVDFWAELSADYIVEGTLR